MTTIQYHTKEEALEAIIEDSANELELCTPELQNNEEVVMEAVKQDSLAFRYASEALRSNKAFVIKALNEGASPWGLLNYANMSLQSDLDVMFLAIEKSSNGWSFACAKGEVALNKKLAAKALVKWGNCYGKNTINLWDELNPTIKECFPSHHFYEKAQAYLIQLEQGKQAELVSGGSTEEDKVVW